MFKLLNETFLEVIIHIKVKIIFNRAVEAIAFFEERLAPAILPWLRSYLYLVDHYPRKSYVYLGR